MVTATYTNRQIVTDAFRKIGVVATDSTMTADEAATGGRALNRLLKAFQNRGYNLWTTTQLTVSLTTAASYTMTPVRPIRIHGARFVRSGIETPMQELTRQEYDDLPIKTATGIPTCYYYDRQKEAALLYIWPVLAAANGETLKVTYEREIADVDLDAEADVTGEWWDAVVYNLAARLADDFQVDAPSVVARAEEELRLALAADREGSVWFN